VGDAASGGQWESMRLEERMDDGGDYEGGEACG